MNVGQQYLSKLATIWTFVAQYEGSVWWASESGGEPVRVNVDHCLARGVWVEATAAQVVAVQLGRMWAEQRGAPWQGDSFMLADGAVKLLSELMRVAGVPWDPWSVADVLISAKLPPEAALIFRASRRRCDELVGVPSFPPL